MSATESRVRKIPLKTKLAFSTGSLEEAMLGAANITTMLFYNQVLGVSAALCGVVFLIASVIDGISDPLVGSVSDQFHSRWGRRHPFMFFSALPLGISFYFLYQPPQGLGETGLFVWFLAFMVLLRLAKTFYTVPHAALGAELTDDYHERTSLFGYNTVMGMAGGVVLGVFVLMVLFPSTPQYSNGLLDEARYFWLALLGGMFVVAMVLICAWGTRDQIPYLHAQDNERMNVRDFFDNLKQLFINPSYLSVCASWLVMSTMAGVLAMVATYTYIFAYELSTESLTWTRVVPLFGIVAALPLSAYLTRRFDKKLTVIGCCIFVATLVALPHCLRMLGWFPENDSPILLLAVFGPLALAGLLLPVIPITIDSQLVDITDDHELRTGRRAEGVVFSIRTFAMKATSGIGGLIGGFGLELINFPENAVVGEVEPSVLMGLLFMAGPLYIIVVGGGMLFMALYKIDEKRHQEILAELAVRRARNETAGQPDEGDAAAPELTS